MFIDGTFNNAYNAADAMTLPGKDSASKLTSFVMCIRSSLLFCAIKSSTDFEVSPVSILLFTIAFAQME